MARIRFQFIAVFSVAAFFAATIFGLHAANESIRIQEEYSLLMDADVPTLLGMTETMSAGNDTTEMTRATRRTEATTGRAVLKRRIPAAVRVKNKTNSMTKNRIKTMTKNVTSNAAMAPLLSTTTAVSSDGTAQEQVQQRRPPFQLSPNADYDELQKQLLKDWQYAKDNVLFNSLIDVGATLEHILLHIPRVEISNAIARHKQLDLEDVVVATHLGARRFDNLMVQLEWWNGPTSIAVYVTGEEDIQTFVDFLRNTTTTTNPITDIITQASFHIIMERPDLYYPHNILRNVAMQYTETDYFIGMDADLISLPNGHDETYQLIHNTSKSTRNIRNMLRNEKYLFVLAAFSVFPRPNETVATPDLLPSTSHEIERGNRNHTIRGFKLKSWGPGHSPTNFNKWEYIARANHNPAKLRASKAFNVSLEDPFYPIEHKPFFEPYILAYRPGLPKMWDTFRGFGYNKWTWFVQLDVVDYRYVVFHDLFVCHLDHPKVPKPNRKRTNKFNRERYREMLIHLNATYGLKNGTAEKLWSL